MYFPRSGTGRGAGRFVEMQLAQRSTWQVRRTREVGAWECGDVKPMQHPPSVPLSWDAAELIHG